jgi:hypothetical protein
VPTRSPHPKGRLEHAPPLDFWIVTSNPRCHNTPSSAWVPPFQLSHPAELSSTCGWRVGADGKMHKVRADAKVTIDDEETLNLEDWINIFHGPPCDVDAMVELVQENNRRGKYIPPKEETPEGKTYANANQKVRRLKQAPSGSP